MQNVIAPLGTTALGAAGFGATAFGDVASGRGTSDLWGSEDLVGSIAAGGFCGWSEFFESIEWSAAATIRASTPPPPSKGTMTYRIHHLSPVSVDSAIVGDVQFRPDAICDGYRRRQSQRAAIIR